MEISWLGHSCFRIKGKGGTVITDPFTADSGYQLGKINADIVTVSHDHPNHCNVDAIKGEPKIVTGPGEYEIGGIFIYGVRTFHDTEKGQQHGKNTCYLLEVDDIKVCHLGDLGHVPTAAQVDEISDADVLMIPVGGATTIDAVAAMEIVNLLSPKFVIPMHYKTDVSKAELDPIDKFIKEIGLKEVTPVPKLVANKTMLPLETDLVVLDYKG